MSTEVICALLTLVGTVAGRLSGLYIRLKTKLKRQKIVEAATGIAVGAIEEENIARVATLKTKDK